MNFSPDFLRGAGKAAGMKSCGAKFTDQTSENKNCGSRLSFSDGISYNIDMAVLTAKI